VVTCGEAMCTCVRVGGGTSGQSAFWRHRRPSVRIDLSPGATSCQAIDFQLDGPTIAMVTCSVAVLYSKVCVPRSTSERARAIAGVDKRYSFGRAIVSRSGESVPELRRKVLAITRLAPISRLLFKSE